MQKIKIYPTSVDLRGIARAAATLASGGIIIYPTDTVYAWACDSLNNRAISRLCAIKGINPDRQLLSIVCSDISQAAEYARIDNNAYAMLRANLPGPFTFILPASPRLPKAFKGRRTVGVRVPDNEISRALARELGHPVLSSSLTVDPSDPWTAVNPDSIMMELHDRADLIIDGGEGGTELSTVVDLTAPDGPAVTRQGKGELC